MYLCSLESLWSVIFTFSIAEQNKLGPKYESIVKSNIRGEVQWCQWKTLKSWDVIKIS